MLPVHNAFWIGEKPVHPEIAKLKDLEESYAYCLEELGVSKEDMAEMAQCIEAQRKIVAELHDISI